MRVGSVESGPLLLSFFESLLFFFFEVPEPPVPVVSSVLLWPEVSIPELLCRLRLLPVSDVVAEPVELVSSFEGVTPAPAGSVLVLPEDRLPLLALPVVEPEELEPPVPLVVSLLELVPAVPLESEVDPVELMPPEPPPPPGRRSRSVLPLDPVLPELPVPDPELPDVLLPLRS